jgi:hypothetical protein
VVKRTSTLVLSIVTAVILACVVPIADQPETPFNEADTPVNQATVIAPVRVAPPSEMTPLPVFRATSAQGTSRMPVEPKPSPRYSASVPLRSLLCTFLI